MKKFKNRVLIFIIIISIIRIFMGYLLPTFYFKDFYHDDLLSLNISNSLYNLNWLGTYSSTTLVKGFVFPLLMAIFKFLNVNIGIGLSLIYVLSSVLFCYSIKDFFKNKKIVYLLYILLIFNPISFSSETFQRLYRNSISYSLMLFILGFLFLVFKTSFNNKKIYLYLLLFGLSLIVFMFLREDYIWIFPVILFIIIIKLFKEFSFKNLFIIIIPFILVVLLQFIVRGINYSYYGMFTLNELNDSNYKKAYLELLRIKPDNYYDRVSLSNSTLLKAFEYSPTLDSIKGEILINSLYYNDDGGLIDGYMIWHLRRVVENKGIYKTSKEAEAFWYNVYMELKEARQNNKYETRFVLPSILISPLTKNNIINFIKTFPDTFIYVFTYDDLKSYSYEDLKSSNIKIKHANFYNNSLELNINNNEITYDICAINNNLISKFFNSMTYIYKISSMIFNIMGILSFIILLFNKKYKKLIISISMFISFTVLLCGITYTHVSAFDAIRYFYLSPAYIIFIIFSFSSIVYLLEEVNHEKIRFNNFNALFKRD